MSNSLNETRLSIGVLDDFKGDTTILILGYSDSFAKLATLMRATIGGEVPALSITDLDFVDVYGPLSLTLYCVGEGKTKGCIKSEGPGENSYQWILDDEACLEYCEKLELLAGSDGLGISILRHFIPKLCWRWRRHASTIQVYSTDTRRVRIGTLLARLNERCAEVNRTFI